MVAFLVRTFQKLLKNKVRKWVGRYGEQETSHRGNSKDAQRWCSVIRGHGIISTHFGNVTFEMHNRHPNELFRK